MGKWETGRSEENGLVMSDGKKDILSFGSVVFSWAKAQHLGYITQFL